MYLLRVQMHCVSMYRSVESYPGHHEPEFVNVRCVLEIF